MSNETSVTAHVHECVKILSRYLQSREHSRAMEKSYPVPSDADAFEAVFNLVDMPWDELAEDHDLFREGYETAVLDVVEAIAQSWDLELPQLRVRNEPSE